MSRSLSPDTLHEVYAAIGSAVWHLQFLEDVVVTYLTMRLRLSRPLTQEQAFAVLAAERQKTLGVLFNDAKAGGLVKGDLAKAFDALLTERNWLIHRAMLDCSDRLYTDEGVSTLLSRVRLLAQSAIDLKKRIYDDVRTWCIEGGVDIAKAEAIAERDFRTIRGA